MEWILLLSIIGVFYLTRRAPKNSSQNKRSKSSSRRNVSSNNIVPIRGSKGHPPKFNQSKAKHLAAKRVVSGRAWVVDGDTIKIKNVQIRLFGIDAPELNHPYGVKSKWALHKLTKGHDVHAEIVDVDDYGRTVAKCFLSDGRDLSAELVKQGLALDWPKFSEGIYSDLETLDARKKLFLADARQKGRMHVWKTFDAQQKKQ